MYPMKTLTLAGLALAGSLLSSTALAYGPGPDHCEERAALHWAIASQLGDEGLGDGPGWDDAAWEDAVTACGAEPTLQEALKLAQACPVTGWAEYAPGGYRAVCGDEDGGAL